MIRRPSLALLLLTALLASGCRTAAPQSATSTPAPAPPAPATAPLPAAPPPGPTTLDAVVWLQGSAEAHALFVGTFASAGHALERALADSSASALDQGPAAAALPPAVIADIDETLLDNSPFAARMIESGARFDRAVWAEWLASGQVAPFPGAAEFAQRAAQAGVTLFYVSNSNARLETAIRANLARGGFPLDDAQDTVMLFEERPEWTSDKQSRREAIARTHRVLLLLGDDLNDFVSGARGATPEAREEMVERARAHWGRDWFMLPNPTYGSWETALTGGAQLSEEELAARKRATLRSYH
jgi:acid phosphatase